MKTEADPIKVLVHCILSGTRYYGFYDDIVGDGGMYCWCWCHDIVTQAGS